MYLASALSKLRVNCQTLVMKRFMLLMIFVLASVEVADGVVYSWILSVNPVDTDEGKQTTSDNNTKENSTLQNVSTISTAVLNSVPVRSCACHTVLRLENNAMQLSLTANTIFIFSPAERTDIAQKEITVTNTTANVMLARR